MRRRGYQTAARPRSLGVDDGGCIERMKDSELGSPTDLASSRACNRLMLASVGAPPCNHCTHTAQLPSHTAHGIRTRFLGGPAPLLPHERVLFGPLGGVHKAGGLHHHLLEVLLQCWQRGLGGAVQEKAVEEQARPGVGTHRNSQSRATTSWRSSCGSGRAHLDGTQRGGRVRIAGHHGRRHALQQRLLLPPRLPGGQQAAAALHLLQCSCHGGCQQLRHGAVPQVIGVCTTAGERGGCR